MVRGLGFLLRFLNFLGVLVTRKEVEKENEKRREKMGDEDAHRGGGEDGDGDGDGERNGIRVLVVRKGLRFSRRQAMDFPAM